MYETEQTESNRCNSKEQSSKSNGAAFPSGCWGGIISYRNLCRSVQGMVSSIGGAIGSIIPVALPLVGVSMAITIALAIFKKVTNKA